MTVLLALTDSRLFWTIALGMGAVVIAVVIVLMVLLLSYLGDIGRSVTRLLEVSGQVAQNTSPIVEFAATGQVLEMIKDEALIHDGYLESQLR